MTNLPFPIYVAERQQKPCLLVLHYTDQVCAREPTFTISYLTVHYRAFCTNAHYAWVGSLVPSELARLECAFLATIDWRIACTREVL